MVVEKTATKEQATTTVLPLESGDRLTRAEFERRYDAMPHICKWTRGVLCAASCFLDYGSPSQRYWKGIWLMCWQHCKPDWQRLNTGHS